jgi:hypothetical protein
MFQVVNAILKQTVNPAVKLFSKKPIVTTSLESYLETKGAGLKEKTFIVCPLQSLVFIMWMMTAMIIVFHILIPKCENLPKEQFEYIIAKTFCKNKLLNKILNVSVTGGCDCKNLIYIMLCVCC